jgi:hypothetical protein
LDLPGLDRETKYTLRQSKSVSNLGGRCSSDNASGVFDHHCFHFEISKEELEEYLLPLVDPDECHGCHWVDYYDGLRSLRPKRGQSVWSRNLRDLLSSWFLHDVYCWSGALQRCTCYMLCSRHCVWLEPCSLESNSIETISTWHGNPSSDYVRRDWSVPKRIQSTTKHTRLLLLFELSLLLRSHG